jgi:hypothetical protein
MTNKMGKKNISRLYKWATETETGVLCLLHPRNFKLAGVSKDIPFENPTNLIYGGVFIFVFRVIVPMKMQSKKLK